MAPAPKAKRAVHADVEVVLCLVAGGAPAFLAA